nr:hypothetical protein Ade03nite_88890 [Actinoplanes derwentensis]
MAGDGDETGAVPVGDMPGGEAGHEADERPDGHRKAGVTEIHSLGTREKDDGERHPHATAEGIDDDGEEKYVALRNGETGTILRL